MNKIIASVGVIALSAAAVHAVGIENVETGKPFTLGLSLRGFYDDNYVTSSAGQERETLGMSIAPSIAYRIDPSDRTSLGMRYTFQADWFEDRESFNAANDAWDFSHLFDAFLEHAFSQRVSLSVRDTFVISQEPGLVNDVAQPYRTEGDNLRNVGEANLTTVLTRQLSLVLGYRNTFTDYENEGGNALQPSLSALLDRMEQIGLINLRWQALKESTIVFGYNYQDTGYNSDEAIAIVNAAPVTSDYRNQHSHTAYLGLDQNLSENFIVTARGGAQLVDYYNDPFTDDSTSPYGMLTLNYRYRPNSSVSVGWTYQHSATDLVSVDNTNNEITQDQNSSVLFAGLSHYFNARWQGKARMFWQNSTFNGGTYDDQTDDFFGATLGLSYFFTRNLSADVEYNFDTLSSDIPGRDYDRNRLFLGVTATY
jgi:hypothetical protein